MVAIPTEAEVERQPDAVAGRALLEARLSRYGQAEVAAFWEAVGRCYAGSRGEEAPDTTTLEDTEPDAG